MTVHFGDSHEQPIYGCRFRMHVAMLDADGDPTTPTSPDTEISKDSGTWADATNEYTEETGGAGDGYVDFTATEMTSKVTKVRVKGTGVKTPILVLNPKRFPILHSGTAQAGASQSMTLATGASAITDYYVGCYLRCANDTPANVSGQARKITAYDGSTKVATVEAAWGTTPSSSTTYEVLQTPDAVVHIATLPTALPGAANGMLIAGTNAAVTITSSAGSALTLSSTGGNGHGVNISGNGSGSGINTKGGGTGHGVLATGGDTSGHGINAQGSSTSGSGLVAVSNAGDGHGISATGNGTGHGLRGVGGGTSGNGANFSATAGNAAGMRLAGILAGSGLRAEGGVTGAGIGIIGGSASGNGVNILTTSGDGLSIAPTAGHAIVATGNGTSKHGAVFTGGTAGTSDGLKALAGTGGVDIRGELGSAMTESYAAPQAAMTPAQALYAIVQILEETTGGSTTLTTKKRDQATTALTRTVNNASSPTTITRAT